MRPGSDYPATAPPAGPRRQSPGGYPLRPFQAEAQWREAEKLPAASRRQSPGRVSVATVSGGTTASGPEDTAAAGGPPTDWRTRRLYLTPPRAQPLPAPRPASAAWRGRPDPRPDPARALLPDAGHRPTPGGRRAPHILIRRLPQGTQRRGPFRGGKVGLAEEQVFAVVELPPRFTLSAAQAADRRVNHQVRETVHLAVVGAFPQPLRVLVGRITQLARNASRSDWGRTSRRSRSVQGQGPLLLRHEQDVAVLQISVRHRASRSRTASFTQSSKSIFQVPRPLQVLFDELR